VARAAAAHRKTLSSSSRTACPPELPPCCSTPFSSPATPTRRWPRKSPPIGIELGKASVGRFSDGEVTVEIQQNVRARDVFVVQSTCAPTNET
jgi:hypothetical protein